MKENSVLPVIKEQSDGTFRVPEFPGNAYRWVGEGADMSLQTAPLWKDGTIDHEQWGEVSEEVEPRWWMRGKFAGSEDG